jgi:hypothetical protein
VRLAARGPRPRRRSRAPSPPEPRVPARGPSPNTAVELAARSVDLLAPAGPAASTAIPPVGELLPEERHAEAPPRDEEEASAEISRIFSAPRRQSPPARSDLVLAEDERGEAAKPSVDGAGSRTAMRPVRASSAATAPSSGRPFRGPRPRRPSRRRSRRARRARAATRARVSASGLRGRRAVDPQDLPAGGSPPSAGERRASGSRSRRPGRARRRSCRSLPTRSGSGARAPSRRVRATPRSETSAPEGPRMAREERRALRPRSRRARGAGRSRALASRRLRPTPRIHRSAMRSPTTRTETEPKVGDSACAGPELGTAAEGGLNGSPARPRRRDGIAGGTGSRSTSPPPVVGLKRQVRAAARAASSRPGSRSSPRQPRSLTEPFSRTSNRSRTAPSSWARTDRSG